MPAPPPMLPSSALLAVCGRWVLPLATAAAVLFAVRMAIVPTGPLGLGDDLLFHAALVGATLACGLRAATERRERGAWLAVAGAIGSWELGWVYWELAVEDLPTPPHPSPADVAWLGFYPLAYAGIVLLLRRDGARLRASAWLDGLIGGLAAASVGAALIYDGIAAGANGGVAATAMNLAYPLGDLLLLAFLVGGFVAGGRRPPAAHLLLAGSIAVLAVADSVYLYRVAAGTYETGTLAEALWPAGMVLIALAARRDPVARPVRADDRASLACTSVATLVAVGLLVAGTGGPRTLVTALATATLLAACARTAMAFRELAALADTRRQAVTDELTGLPNRRHLLDRLDGAVADAAGGNGRVAFLLIDLDGFKDINDTLGHAAGDALLRSIGPRLADALGPDDVIARLGGDEFGVLLPGADHETALVCGHWLRAVLEPPFTVEGIGLAVEASVGIAAFPDQAATAEELVQRADVAMYRAKTTRSGVEVYAPDFDRHSRDRLVRLGELRAAIGAGQLVVHYQPQADARSGAVVGVEALVRWQHPEDGLLGPARFLPAAEQAGLMRQLTLHVLEQAVAQVAAWHADGTFLRVSVNLAVVNLIDRGLPDDVAAVLDRHGVDPRYLTLEVTENVVMADPARAAVVLEELRATGVEVALDDFGTGHASMAWLTRLPVDELKIDRSFVSAVDSDTAAAAIVRATVDLARALGLRTVAEGAEDVSTWGRLAGFGCTLVQGYVLSRPLPADALTTWLATRSMVGVEVPALSG